jgi:predicted membrane channel-forming protein YqfA (hemolysin III family)
MSKQKIHKVMRYILLSLPLVGVVYANFLQISARAHQFLIFIVLLWFNVFILLEVYSNGK